MVAVYIHDPHRYRHNINKPQTISTNFAAIAFPVLGRDEFSFVVAGAGNMGESGRLSNFFSSYTSFEVLVGVEWVESFDDIERVVFRRSRMLIEICSTQQSRAEKCIWGKGSKGSLLQSRKHARAHLKLLRQDPGPVEKSMRSQRETAGPGSSTTGIEKRMCSSQSKLSCEVYATCESDERRATKERKVAVKVGDEKRPALCVD